MEYELSDTFISNNDTLAKHLMSQTITLNYSSYMISNTLINFPLKQFISYSILQINKLEYEKPVNFLYDFLKNIKNKHKVINEETVNRYLLVDNTTKTLFINICNSLLIYLYSNNSFKIAKLIIKSLFNLSILNSPSNLNKNETKIKKIISQISNFEINNNIPKKSNEIKIEPQPRNHSFNIHKQKGNIKLQLSPPQAKARYKSDNNKLNQEEKYLQKFYKNLSKFEKPNKMKTEKLNNLLMRQTHIGNKSIKTKFMDQLQNHFYSVENEMIKVNLLNHLACFYYKESFYNIENTDYLNMNAVKTITKCKEIIQNIDKNKYSLRQLDFFQKLDLELDQLSTLQNYVKITKNYSYLKFLYDRYSDTLLYLYTNKTLCLEYKINDFHNKCYLISQFVLSYAKYLLKSNKLYIKSYNYFKKNELVEKQKKIISNFNRQFTLQKRMSANKDSFDSDDENSDSIKSLKKAEFLLELGFEFTSVTLEFDEKIIKEYEHMINYLREDLESQIIRTPNDENILTIENLTMDTFSFIYKFNSIHKKNTEDFYPINHSHKHVTGKYIDHFISFYKKHPIVSFFKYIKKAYLKVITKHLLTKRGSSLDIRQSTHNEKSKQIHKMMKSNLSSNFNFLMENIDRGESILDTSKFNKNNFISDNLGMISPSTSEVAHLTILGLHFGGMTTSNIAKVLKNDNKYLLVQDSSYTNIIKIPKNYTLMDKWFELELKDKKENNTNYNHSYESIFRIVYSNKEKTDGYYTLISYYFEPDTEHLIITASLLDKLNNNNNTLFELQPLRIEKRKIKQMALSCSILLSTHAYFNINSIVSIRDFLRDILIKHVNVNLNNYSVEIKTYPFGFFGENYIDFLNNSFLFDLFLHCRQYLNMYLYNAQYNSLYFDLFLDEQTFDYSFTYLLEENKRLSYLVKKDTNYNLFKTKLKEINNSATFSPIKEKSKTGGSLNTNINYRINGFIYKELINILPKIQQIIWDSYIKQNMSSNSLFPSEIFSYIQNNYYFKLSISKNWEKIEFWYITLNNQNILLKENDYLLQIQYSELKKISLADCEIYIQKFSGIRSNDILRLLGIRLEYIFDYLSVKDKHVLLYIILNTIKLKDTIFKSKFIIIK